MLHKFMQDAMSAEVVSPAESEITPTEIEEAAFLLSVGVCARCKWGQRARRKRCVVCCVALKSV